MIPVTTVCNLGTGYTKPFLLLLIAVVALIFGIALLLLNFFLLSERQPDAEVVKVGFVSVLIGVACLIAYFLKKTLTLFFMPSSGNGICVAFKRSVIEGVEIDEYSAQKIVDIVSDLIERKSKKDVSVTVNQKANEQKNEVRSEKATPQNDSFVVTCPHCGQEVEVPYGLAPGQHVRCPYCDKKFSV